MNRSRTDTVDAWKWKSTSFQQIAVGENEARDSYMNNFICTCLERKKRTIVLVLLGAASSLTSQTDVHTTFDQSLE